MFFRFATESDVPKLCAFTDFWLAGRGKRVCAPGAVDDYWISPSQHMKYVRRYRVGLVFSGEVLVGWGVVGRGGCLYHLLVAGDRRGEGIGTALLEFLGPDSVRVKVDQSSGNPRGFYERLGYKAVQLVRSVSRYDIERLRPGRAANILLMGR